MIAIQTVLILVTIVGTAAACTRWRARYELQAIEKALYLEIVSMRFQAGALAAELARRKIAGQPLDADFFAAWRLSAPLIYPAIGGDLGRLSAGSVNRVGLFHAQLAEARRRIAEVRSGGETLSSPHRLLGNLLRAHNHVEVWTDLLLPRLGRLGGGDLDLREAGNLLEDLEKASGEEELWAYCWVDACILHPKRDASDAFSDEN